MITPTVRVLLLVLQTLLDAWVRTKPGSRADMEVRELARLILVLIAFMREKGTLSLGANPSPALEQLEEELRAWELRFLERTRQTREQHETSRGRADLGREQQIRDRHPIQDED